MRHSGAGLASHARPSPLDGVGSAGQQPGARTGCPVVAESVELGAAAVAGGMTASTGCQGQRQAQAPAQGNLEEGRIHAGARAGGEALQPSACLWTRARAEHGLSGRAEGRQ